MRLSKLRDEALLQNKSFRIDLRILNDLLEGIAHLRKRLEKEKVRPTSRSFKYISIQLEEATDAFEKQRQRMMSTYGVYVSEDAKFALNMYPVSCFSLPIQPPFFEAESLLWSLQGKKMLNRETKQSLIKDNRHLFLKVDLTYDKEEIEFAVGELVQHAQKLLGKKKRAKTDVYYKLFDNIFSDAIMDMRLVDALEKTANVLRDRYEKDCDAEVLQKTYYKEWKTRNDVRDIRQWKRRAKAELEALEQLRKETDEYLVTLFKEEADDE
jgi:hypothetical protein